MAFAKDSNFRVPLWVDGVALTPEDSPFYKVTTPPDHETAWEACAATPATTQDAIAAAAKAFPAWSKTSLAFRRSIFAKAADLLETRGEEVEYYFRKEIAGVKAWSGFNLNFCIDALRGIGDILDEALRTETIQGKDGMEGIINKVPYGVVTAIAPWNAPLILGLRSVLAPIAAGNTVVMLAAPLSPMTHHFIGQLLNSSGLPPGVLNILPAPPEPDHAAAIVETLLSNPSVRFLNFTGSTLVGRKINEVAGRYSKPVIMELGGKCAVLALPDADIDALSHELIIGAYLNSGQICMSTEHAVIPTSILPRLIEKLKAEAASIFPSPLPLITVAAKQKVDNLVQDALSKGAEAHVIATKSETTDQNSLISPLIITGVRREMQIYSTETFGPVFCIIPYDDNVEEGIKIVNDLEHGLSVSIFSGDETQALRVANEIDSGAVHINHMTVYDNPSFPHGGAKASGYGRFGGKWGIESFTYIKTVTRRR